MACRQKPLSKLSEVTQQDNLSKAKSPRKRMGATSERAHRARVAAAVPALKAVAPESIAVEPPTVLDPEAIAAQKVEEAKKCLGNLECEVISALFPPCGLPQSVEDVAAKLGMNIQEVKDIADNALRGLRGPKTLAPRPSNVWN